MPCGRRILLFICLATLPVFAQKAPTLEYYLPPETTFDPAIPTPAEVFGWEPGTWHLRHDQIVRYFEVLAEKSDRVTLKVTGHSHEQRPLQLATITSPKNHINIDRIRRRHLKLVEEPEAEHDYGSMPVITWLGYGVHGNESSASNAAPIVAYILAAAQGKIADEMLEKSVVLLDPCINPDGLSRFAHWANMHKGKQLVADAMHREHREPWPSGRTNHYWFDLNRDWLLLRHPESRARVAAYRAWMPNVLTDHHEMGTNSSFFFQPGVRSRGNPLTPDRNFELTAKLAEFHAKRLDQVGSLYFTEEQFDDFYYGKGSTYPDVNGAVGILFEQASSRGHLQESVNGVLSFPFTIKNQVIVSLTTLQGSVAMREDLLRWQAEFYKTAKFEAAADSAAAWVFGEKASPTRTRAALELLLRHGIEVHPLLKDFETGEGDAKRRFEKGKALVVRADQRQYRLAKALFERRTKFRDDTFYDVSAWTMPLAFDLPYGEIPNGTDLAPYIGNERPSWPDPDTWGDVGPGAWTPTPGTVAYVFDWRDDSAMKVLPKLLAAGIRVRVTTKPFRGETPQGPVEFGYGQLVVPVGIQDQKGAALNETLVKLTRGTTPKAVLSGLTKSGVDLGSSSLRPLVAPKLALVVGSGVSAYEAGEVWHLLDVRLGMPVTLLRKDDIERASLARYTHLLMVGGSYSDLDKDAVERLQNWVREGGVVVASKSAATWAGEKLLELKPEPSRPAAASASDSAKKKAPAKDGKKPEPKKARYADRGARSAQNRISGAIFRGLIDPTHPLGYGYEDGELALFKNSTTVMAKDRNAVRDVVRYAVNDTRLAGFANDRRIAAIAGTAAVNQRSLGRGSVVRIVDNLNFRAWWLGGTRLYLNAIFFSRFARAAEGTEDDEHEHSHGH